MTFLLIDCNQFFVSCEQVFNPRLIGQPVVVLSSNDGCVVSRSKEAKALGIPMGAPAYQYADLFKTGGVYVFSSNFALYADMSRRVMEVLHTLSPHVEEYSVDEAFLVGSPEEAPSIREKILKWTGIPVSIGIGKTKTLAKVANDLAKKSSSGILELLDEKTIDAHLEKLPPSEIWGVGSRLNAQLREEKIFSALQLKNASEIQIKKRFSVILLRTVLELRGIPSLSLEEVPEIRKSLTCSRTFGERLTELADIEEAVASYISSAAEKLRAEELFTSSLTVYITTSPFLKPPDYYSNALTLTLDEPTSYTPLLITSAKEALRKIYRKGFLYKKAGITFGEITSSRVVQTDLFSAPVVNEKRKRAMELVDQVNHTFGRGELRFAAEGFTKKWKGAKKSRSAHYTTRWSGLLEIKI